MKKITMICFAMLLILLSGCSHGKQFTGGVFYNPNIESIYTFNEDGTGEFTRSDIGDSWGFDWKNADGYILTDSSVVPSYFIYTGECLVFPMSRVDGIIPDKSTFNAELVFQTYNQCVKYTFCDDGTATVDYDYGEGGEGEFEIIYERNGDYILLLRENGYQFREFLVTNGAVYGTYLRPYDGEHTD